MAPTLVGAAANIALDPLFIFVFHMNVAGAALATVLSQVLSFVFVLLFLLRKSTKIKQRMLHIIKSCNNAYDLIFLFRSRYNDSIFRIDN